jgi:ribosomal protein S18 acetylase RimI-like enzyme
MSPRAIDLATITAWPAAITEQHNGWYYLAAGGITGRVNAVWPLDWSGDDLEAAIAHAEAWYEARNLPPRFKLTDGACAPASLAEALAQRGYTCVAPTLIMTAPIRPIAAPEGVFIFSEMPAAFDAVLRQTAKDESEYDERLGIALRAPAPACYATHELDSRTVAIGMTASAGDLAGIFLMRTAPEARRKGIARKIFQALMAESAVRGATTAFLQVDADNAPAIALYESEGFARLTTYRFWRL